MARALGALSLALALTGAAVPAAAQPAQDVAGLSWLVGSWLGTGTMLGRPSQAELVIRPVLGGRFLELSYRAGGFEGRAFYHSVGTGRWQANWFDNRGVRFAIEATAADRTLTADWGSPETEQGRTVYRLADDGRLHVSDSVQRDGALRPFASYTLIRAD
jgi:hypothetical protein